MKIIIDESAANQRLDRFLMKFFPKAGRGEIYRLIRKKDVRINGKVAREKDRIELHDELDIYLKEDLVKSWSGDMIEARPGSIDIVYEDEDDLVVYKPQGLKTTPDSRGEDSLSSRVQAYLEADISRTFRPSPLGRLDKDTRGLVLFTKNYQRTKELEELQRQRGLEKLYLALIFGTIEEGLCEIRLEKKANEPGVKLTEEGKKAITDFKVLARKDGYSLVEAQLITGRTHQIRASIAHLGGQILGDELYGRGRGGQSLICYKLAWQDKEVFYLPDDFIELMRKVGFEKRDYFNTN
ncbi:MAG: RluA family pseudouridine synthase [Tissierellia bacterium]|nr:RluA family pseudouridine synthase [Tissierellia bacterium]